MFDFIGRRVLSLLLVISLCVSLCAPSALASGIGHTDGRDMDSVEGWENLTKNAKTAVITAWAAYYNVDASATAFLWEFVNSAHNAQNVELGEVTPDQLTAICSRFNSYFNTPSGPVEDILKWCKDEFGTRVVSNLLAWALGIKAPLSFVVKKHESSGVSRIWEETNGLWVVNSSGQYFCYDHSNDPDIWISRNDATHMISSKNIEIRTGENLASMAAILKMNGDNVSFTTLVGPTGIQWKAITFGGKIRANANGVPYAAPADDSYFAVIGGGRGEDTVVKDENGEEVEDLPAGNTTNIDLGGMTINLPDGLELAIDSINYNEADRTYNIEALYYDQTNNTYVTYNLHWEYHINYTSITYIGQTEQYDKYYEVYYELPDGRDSAELTKEELEQLNVSMDVIPYGRSTDYVHLRSLYHFDGDVKDSSYWNYCTNFDWVHGASLTYMDAGVFKGALYLDEGLHTFDITLPSPVYTDNFTLQFRYYQSATPAPVTDSSIRFEGTEGSILRWDGKTMYDINGDVVDQIPTGTWNEIAITRYRYALRYYVNGVCVREIENRASFGDEIRFSFGSQQQTYKYFDELRFLGHALVDDGGDYTPTSVPHDTNLSLVLPTDAVPLADEYWDFNAEGNLFEFYDYSVYSNNEDWLVDTGLINIGDNQDKWHRKSDSLVTAVCQDGYVTIANGSDVSTWSYLTTADNFNIITFPLYTYGINGTLGRQGTANYSFVQGGTYTYSFMTADGQLYSYTFTTPESQPTKGYVGNKVQLGNGAYVAMTVFSASSTSKAGGVALTLSPPANGQLDIVYMELVEGTEPNTGHEWVESVTVIDKEDINKATLAVRTDIPITKYYIGGVRPSVPHKGYVWALVENQRITSLQIYNGQAWEAVDGRIWTGQRWVPYSSYNIVTLQDMYDMQDGTPNYDYIYTEQGFWSWWQRSWNEFTAKFFNVMGNGTGTNDPSKLPTDDTEDPESSGQNFTHFIVVLRDGFWSICVGLADAVYGGFEGFADSVSTVGSFFTSYGSGEDSIWLLPLEEGVTIWD